MAHINDLYYGTLDSPRSPYDPKKHKPKKNRFKYFTKNIYCYYCKCKMQHTGLQIPTQATLDHLYFRWDIRRALSREVVPCCYTCNQRKNEEDDNKLNEGYDKDFIDAYNFKLINLI